MVVGAAGMRWSRLALYASLLAKTVGEYALSSTPYFNLKPEPLRLLL
ncbi:MAG: hypothetical protein QXO32_01970 [Candidatus Bathyarchaeia archaeon]